MLIELQDAGLIYNQIYQSIRMKILAGELRPGTQLPSTRLLADELKVSRNSVLIAYDQLTAEGYILGRHGSGTYVAPIPDSYLVSDAAPASDRMVVAKTPRLSDYAVNLGDRLPEPPYRVGADRTTARYDFRHGHPPIDVLSERIWRRLIAHRAQSFLARDEVGYGPPEGHPGLRQAIAAYLCARRGVQCEASQVVIVNGSQQAIDLTARILVNPGDNVVVEEPCYPGARLSLTGLGAKIHAVGVDGDGLKTDELGAIREPIKLIYVTPSHQYPTGSVMPLSRRLALIAFARKSGAFIIEDDYDSEFRYDAAPEKSLQGLDPSGPVVYVGTFSKVLFPSLRLGFVVLPRTLVEPLMVAKSVADRYTAPFAQAVVAEFLREGHFERHIRRVRVQVSERRSAMIAALRTEFDGNVEIRGARAGVHLLSWFTGLDAASLKQGIARAAELGVGAHSVDPCYASPPARAGLVMGYAGMTPHAIREGVRLLARAFRSI